MIDGGIHQNIPNILYTPFPSSSESVIVNESTGTVFLVVTAPKFSFVCLSSIGQKEINGNSTRVIWLC